MRTLHLLVVLCVSVILGLVQQQRPTPANGGLIGGSILPDKPDARGWGWQVKALMNPDTPRPLYNKAKELLLQDKVITSYTRLMNAAAAADEIRRIVWSFPHDIAFAEGKREVATVDHSGRRAHQQPRPGHLPRRRPDQGRPRRLLFRD